MVKTLLIPLQTQISIVVPQKYVGKQIEILLYALDEVKEEKSIVNSGSSRFKGLLTAEDADKYNTHLVKARNEWDRDI